MLVTIEKVLVLKQIALFKNVSNMALSDLISLSEEMSVKKGIALIEKDRQNKSVFFVLSGTLKCQYQGNPSVMNLSAPQVVGLESAFFVGMPEEDITTITSANILKISSEKLYRMMALHPSLAKAVLHELSEQIHQNRKRY